MISSNNPTNKSQTPCPSNKENVEEPGDKRRRIGLGKMVIPPKHVANSRSKNTLSSVPIQSNRSGAGDSSAGSETGSVCGTTFGMEFKSREDVDNLLNEKMMGKTKMDLKGTAEQNKQKMEYIKKLRACVKMFQKREDDHLLEKEGFLQTVQSLEERIVEIDILAKNKQDELITELEQFKEKYSTLQEICTKEEADKLAAVESYRKEIELKIVAEKSRDTLSESFAKAQQENISLQEILKRNQEYNSSLQQYNSKLQSEATANSEMHSKLQNENNVLKEQVIMFRSKSDILQEQLSSARTSLQDAVKEKEEMKSNLDCNRSELNQIRDERNSQIVQIQHLTADVAMYKNELNTSCIALENVTKRIAEIEVTCSMQKEQMKLLQKELDSANAKLKMADSTNIETRMEYKHQQKLVEDLQISLADAESRILDGDKLRKKLHNTILELKGNIRVFCRVRPMLNDQEHNGSEANHVSYPAATEFLGRGIDLMHKEKKHSFTFDKVFDHEASQESVFVEISQLVQSALDGYKVCIFAYGQTGSGKTYTMMGRPEEPEMKGLIPRSVEQIFEVSQTLLSQGWKYKMQASMLEIYNETVRDLLTSKSNSRDLGKQLDSIRNGNPSDLTVVDVRSIGEVSYLLTQAAQSRSVGKTQMNEQSSRSHFVFILRLYGVNEGTDQQVQGVLNLIDLAGSERLDKSGATGERLKETQHINKSLLSLSEVISSIAKKDDHIPFRNSKLTYLLEPCLGGESKTMMVVNISPEESSSGESKCSLQFASKVNSCEIGVARRQTQMRH